MEIRHYKMTKKKKKRQLTITCNLSSSHAVMKNINSPQIYE